VIVAVSLDSHGRRETQLLDGSVSEMGVWPTGFSGGQLTSMYNNQHTYYGGVF
jgi:hypothetical protein